LPIERLDGHAAKLRLDFLRGASMCVLMPKGPCTADSDLIAALCLEAGRIMENESVTCALAIPSADQELIGRLDQIAKAAADIAVLAAAAQVVHRRAGQL
jgi:hypothetical protein